MVQWLVGLTLCIVCAAAYTNQGAELPRLDNGKPNFSGVWQAFNNANYDIEPHSARAALSMVPGQFGPVPAPEVVKLGTIAAVPGGLGAVVGGQLPYQDWAKAKQQENAANWLEKDPEVRCYLPGIPRANYMPYPFQVFHNSDYLFFAYEYAGATRNVFFADPGEPPADSWMGQSSATWDEDDLVIKVVGQNDRTWFDRSGNFHSDLMVVTERLTLLDPNTIRYQATIEDEQVYTEPWTLSLLLYRRQAEDATLQQFKCVEFVEELLYGHLRKPQEDS